MTNKQFSSLMTNLCAGVILIFVVLPIVGNVIKSSAGSGSPEIDRLNAEITTSTNKIIQKNQH
jgi:hypothetical protein